MNKFFVIIFALLINHLSFGQISTIRPSVAQRGQTLTTTITMANGVFTMSSPPRSSSDIYLQQGATIIYTDYFDASQVYPSSPFPLSDSLYTNFTIPAASPLGWYELHVITYSDFLPWPSNSQDNVMQYAFDVVAPGSCDVPAGTSASIVTNSTAQINWTTPTSADIFRIRYKAISSANYLYVDILGTGGLTSANLTGLLPGTTYSFDVSTICNGLSSTYSVPGNFTTQSTTQSCIVPFNLSAGVTNVSAILSWSSLITADTFRVRYSIQGLNVFKYITINGAMGSQVTATGLQPGTTYTFQVSSICSGVSSGYSTSLNFTTQSIAVACIRPYNLTSSNITNTSALISWSQYVTADTFRIRYQEVGVNNYFYKNISGVGGIFSTTLSSLHPNTSYQFQVTAICSGVSSGYSPTGIFITVNSPVSCVKPIGQNVSNISNTSALISWSNVVTADTFRLRYNITGSLNYLYSNVNGSAGNNFTLSGLLPNTSYDCRISSICLGNSTGYCSPISFTTTNSPVACITPFGTYTDNQTSTTADIHWTPLVTADSFMVRYSVFGTTNYRWKKINGAGGVTSTTLTGLAANTSYQWQVRSICVGVLTSIYSTSAQFFTTLLRMSSNVLVEDELSIFPNPITDVLHFNYYSDSEKEIKIRLIDIVGRDFYLKEESAAKGENNFDINCVGLASGMYQLIVENGNSRKNKLVMIK